MFPRIRRKSLVITPSPFFLGHRVIEFRHERVTTCTSQRSSSPQWRCSSAPVRQTRSPSRAKDSLPKALLVFADDGHVLPSDFPRDIDPFALANFRLSVVRRDIHDPASIRSPAGSLGGECGSGDGIMRAAMRRYRAMAKSFCATG